MTRHIVRRGASLIFVIALCPVGAATMARLTATSLSGSATMNQQDAFAVDHLEVVVSADKARLAVLAVNGAGGVSRATVVIAREGETLPTVAGSWSEEGLRLVDSGLALGDISFVVNRPSGSGAVQVRQISVISGARLRAIGRLADVSVIRETFAASGDLTPVDAPICIECDAGGIGSMSCDVDCGSGEESDCDLNTTCAEGRSPCCCCAAFQQGTVPLCYCRDNIEMATDLPAAPNAAAYELGAIGPAEARR